MKKYILTFLCILAIILTLAIPNTIYDGVSKGIELSIYSVIPALLPFMIITNIMIKNNLCEIISKIFQPILRPIYSLSPNGCFAMMIGFTCGYPMGAKTIGDLYKNQNISLDEAKLLITFCNNCSISFLLNYVSCQCLGLRTSTGTLLTLIYLPAFLTGVINRLLMKPNTYIKNTAGNITLHNPIRAAISSISTLCMYVICFSVIATIIINYVNLPAFYQYTLTGIVEITSGTHFLSTLTDYTLKQFIICGCVVFGGISIMFQSFEQLPDKRLKQYYLIGKLEQLTIYFILYAIVVRTF